MTKTITYQAKQLVFSDDVITGTKKFGGMDCPILESHITGYEWIQISQPYDDELLIIVREQEQKGNARNIEVQE